MGLLIGDRRTEQDVREECADLQAEVDRLHADMAMADHAYRRLMAECGKLRLQNDQLQAENAELRADAKRARGELLAEDDHLIELNQFRQREPLVRQLVGVCEDCAKPGGDIDMAWRALTQYELENGP